MLRIGIIGVGYWGPHYVRIFSELQGSLVRWCCDLDQKNLDRIRKLFPSLMFTRKYMDVLDDREVDAVVIITPLQSHFEIAKRSLEAGKHVLVEKPFTSTSSQARELKRLAEKLRKTLMVGHVYEYNPGVQRLRELIRAKKLGDIYYVCAERLGLGPVRKQASVLWDLATHDISIALSFLGRMPERLSCIGGSYLKDGFEDMVFLNMEFPGKVTYSILTSWIYPEKIRKVSVIGSRGMAVFDDTNKSEMLRIYDRQIRKDSLDTSPEYVDHRLIVSLGDIHIPNIPPAEPLKEQSRHFLDCIRENRIPLTGAESGLAVVKVLEASERSLKSGGTKLDIKNY